MEAQITRSRFAVPAGRMSYIDTGHGDDPVVFVHGNPSSSSEFEPAIGQLRADRRCIAPDHIGFGRSDKPARWDYLPASHASNLRLLLDALDVTDVTMVVGDWGGPIGLSWVLDNPSRVRRVVVTNTWLWPVRRSWYYQGFSQAMGGPIGRHLTRRHNFFARAVVKAAWGRAVPLTSELHAEFTGVHTDPAERNGMWIFPREIVRSSEWLAELWRRRSTLHDLDLRFVWGMRDIAFRPPVLARWLREFPAAPVHRLADVGHFPALEATSAVVAAIRP